MKRHKKGECIFSGNITDTRTAAENGSTRTTLWSSPVQHIVLGTVALEHKATFPAFASFFPNATVWLQPDQWSFPAAVAIDFVCLKQRGPRLREISVPNRAPEYA